NDVVRPRVRVDLLQRPIVFAAQKGKRGGKRACARAGDDLEQRPIAAFAPADQQTGAKRPILLPARKSQEIVGELRPFARQRLPDLLLQGLAIVAVKASIVDANKRDNSRARRQGVQPRVGGATAEQHCRPENETAASFAQPCQSPIPHSLAEYLHTLATRGTAPASPAMRRDGDQI